MKIQTFEGGIVEVDDETAERLIAAGGWKKVRKARATPAPVQEPQTQE